MITCAPEVMARTQASICSPRVLSDRVPRSTGRRSTTSPTQESISRSSTALWNCAPPSNSSARPSLLSTELSSGAVSVTSVGLKAFWVLTGQLRAAYAPSTIAPGGAVTVEVSIMASRSCAGPMQRDDPA